MSTLDVVADVLREVAPRALRARQIVELAAGRLSTASRTPVTVVRRDLALDIKRLGESSRFSRVAPGEFLLKEALPSASAWTGPNSSEVAPSGMLFGRVPGERWPYGPPSAHAPGCNLFPHRGSPGGLFCDCAASAADDVEYGVGA